MQPLSLHGATIPRLGFGTFRLSPRDAYAMVTHALAVGYRHIDTAALYRNEEQVGKAIADSPVPRSDIFLTTKIWPDEYPRFDAALEESLGRLGTEPDLLLLHWPSKEVPLEPTLASLCEAKRRGKTRHIGVSNFTVALLEQAFALADEPLVTNQVEFHPYLSQAKVKAVLDAHTCSLCAYSPLAQGAVLGDETLASIGAAHDKSAAQVALRWLVSQPGVAALPRTKTPKHAETNFEIHDFQLSEAEMAAISALARPDGRVVDPPGRAPDWD